MANGRAIKRKMAKEQTAMGGPPEQAQGVDSPDGFLQAANEGASIGGRGEHVMDMMDPQSMQDVDPKMMQQLETINAAMLDMLYDPKTKSTVQNQLQGGDPGITIPATTNMIMGRFEDIMRPKNGELSLDMKLAVGVQTFQEVMQLAQGMGVLPEEVGDETVEPLLKQSMQQYIQKGLKEKTIDPMELQEAVEPLLTPEEQMIGRGMGQQFNVPGAPTQQQGNQRMMQKARAPLEVQNAQLQKQNKEMTGALKGIASQPSEEA